MAANASMNWSILVKDNLAVTADVISMHGAGIFMDSVTVFHPRSPFCSLKSYRFST